MSELVLRSGRLEDLDALITLENRLFEGDRLSRRAMRYSLTRPTLVLPVALYQSQIVGYGLVAFRKGSAFGRVTSIASDPEAGIKGIGRAVMGALAEAAKSRSCTRLRLEVRADNTRAIQIYERVGFVQFGTYADYYEDGTSVLRFEKVLD